MNIELFNLKFAKAKYVLERLENSGYEGYFVGGCVRDYLLEKDFSDIDITTNALPEQVKEIFSKTIDTGLQHGTVTVLVHGESYEITTFRTESEYTNHRSPDKVEFVSNLKEDLDRRDFTINAMALDLNGKIYDFHNGKVDLDSGIIKTVNDPNDRFYEDALRMLRAFRFSSKLNFEIDNITYEAIAKNAKLIKFVSIERIVTEFKKLLSGIRSEKAFKQLLDSGLNKEIPYFSEVSKVYNFSNFTFCQSMYYLSYLNNIRLDKLKLLKLSNKETVKIKNYDKIKKEFEVGTPLELIVYKNEREDVKFIAELFNYNQKDYIENITLVINSFDDIDITSKEIIDIVNIKPGPWIKEIVTKIEYNILLSSLENKKEKIVDFLLELRDNVNS